MSKIIIPENYTPALNLYDTQRAIGTTYYVCGAPFLGKYS